MNIDYTKLPSFPPSWSEEAGEDRSGIYAIKNTSDPKMLHFNIKIYWIFPEESTKNSGFWMSTNAGEELSNYEKQLVIEQQPMLIFTKIYKYIPEKN